MTTPGLTKNLNHDFAVRAVTSRTASGTPTLAAAVAFKGSREKVSKRVVNTRPDGVSTEITLTDFVITEYDVNAGDIVYTSEEASTDDTKGRPAVDVQKFYDPRYTTPVLDHVEFYL